MSEIDIKHANTIFNASTKVINIYGVGGKLWKRNVAKGARIVGVGWVLEPTLHSLGYIVQRG